MDVHSGAIKAQMPSEAFLNGYGHGNAHDRVMDFPFSYTPEEKFSYWRGFEAGRDVWIAGKPARAWADRHKAKRRHRTTPSGNPRKA